MGNSKKVIRDEDGIILYDSTDDVFEDVTENENQESEFSSEDFMEVLDETDGKFYKMPKMRPEFTGKTLAIYDLEGNLIKRYEEKKSLHKKFYSWLRSLFCFLIISTSTLNNVAQVFNPDKPMIEPFIIRVDDINQRVADITGHDKLTEECGYVRIPSSYYNHNGKSKGIIVVQTWHGTYDAMDSRCPVCFYENSDSSGGEIDPSLPFSACNKCGASADNLKTLGSGQMFRYNFKGFGPVHMDGYVVKEFPKDGKLYLWIYNAPNGTHDEWKQQPENQIIVEAYRKMYHGDSG